MVPGDYINWEGVLAFNTDDSNALYSLNRLNDVRLKTYKDSRTYSPVMITDQGHIQGAVMWADIPAEVKQQEETVTQPGKLGGKRLRVLSNEGDDKQLGEDTPQVVETSVTDVSVDIEDNDNDEEQEAVDVGDALVDGADPYVDDEEGVQADGAETDETVVIHWNSLRIL